METTNTLFVGNLNRRIRWADLKEYFGQWGEVEYTTVALDRESNKSRGFGFVTFNSIDDAIKAKEEAQGQEFEGRELYIEFARPREERPQQEETQEQEETQQELAQEETQEQSQEEQQSEE